MKLDLMKCWNCGAIQEKEFCDNCYNLWNKSWMKGELFETNEINSKTKKSDIPSF